MSLLEVVYFPPHYKLYMLLSLSTLISNGLESTIPDILTQLEQASSVAGCQKAEDYVCPRDEVTFWLSTRRNPNNPIKLDQYNIKSRNNSLFVYAPLKVLIHGFYGTKSTNINPILKPAYFAVAEYNIVSVDWNPLCRFPCYFQAATNVPTVARCVAQFLRGLLSCHPFPSVHLMGHSLGAHVAARASHEIPNLPRLTEFDPALPLFEDGSPLLTKGVAKFIDVYHSNCGLLGRRTPDGDVDVYFNNEVIQPGCICVNLTCSHERCQVYYAEGIRSPGCMVAFPCEGWEYYKLGECPPPRPADLTIVGERINPATRGIYLMFTNTKSPFLVNPSSYTNPETFANFKITSNNVCVNDLNLVIKTLTGQA